MPARVGFIRIYFVAWSAFALCYLQVSSSTGSATSSQVDNQSAKLPPQHWCLWLAEIHLKGVIGASDWPPNITRCLWLAEIHHRLAHS